MQETTSEDMVLKVLRQYVTICGSDGIVETEGSITLGHRFDYKMDKATKSKFRISRSGRLGAAGPQFYDVGTIFHFLKIYADAAASSGGADGDYAAYLEKAISSGATFVRPEDSGQLLEYLQVSKSNQTP